MAYFKGKQFNKDIITVAVGYYLRYNISYREVSEIMKEKINRLKIRHKSYE